MFKSELICFKKTEFMESFSKQRLHIVYDEIFNRTHIYNQSNKSSVVEILSLSEISKENLGKYKRYFSKEAWNIKFEDEEHLPTIGEQLENNIEGENLFIFTANFGINFYWTSDSRKGELGKDERDYWSEEIFKDFFHLRDESVINDVLFNEDMRIRRPIDKSLGESILKTWD